MGKRTGEPAKVAQFRAVPQEPDEGVGVRQVKNERGDIGMPEGLDGITRPAVPPMLFQMVAESTVIEVAEDDFKVVPLELPNGYGRDIT